MPAPSLSVSGFEHKVVVGIADLVVTNNPSAVLTTYSLGSCLGVALYDPAAGVGGLLHAMLPDSSIDPGKAENNPAMFLDTGLPALLRMARELHADERSLSLFVAGGAQIMDNEGFFNIGKRNLERFQAFVQSRRIQVVGDAVGGYVNRTLHLRLASADLLVKVSGQPRELIFSLCGKSTLRSTT